ncbi:MAG TPA: energy-coupling factor transporter transmembrane component T [Syntrophomonadaceae bacterium]|nr:energy-coupling factor transporter transmembrane component T [Syntrophomonadaceae bacterium]
MAGVIEYTAKDTFIHKLNPLSKMAWALLILVLSVIYTDFRCLLGLFLSVLLVALLGKVFKEIAGVFKGLAVFAFILFLMQILFYQPGEVIFTLLPMGKGYLPITDRGILLGIAMAFRMLAVIVSFMVFLSTTRTQDIFNALVEKAGIPYDFSFMVLTAIRFIPTFLNELNQISDAQKARAFVVESRNPIKKVKAYLALAVPLVLFSLKKARQTAIAMETRGYGAGKRTYFTELNMGLQDFIAIGAIILVLAMGITLRISGFGII